MAEQVKFPLFKDLQLGPFRRNRSCGCLVFHGNRIDGTLGEYPNLGESVTRKIMDMDRSEGLTHLCARNTLANRRRAYDMLKEAVTKSGYRIKRDRTLVKRKAGS